MRTTITIDEDVSHMLDEVRRHQGLRLKEAINMALRLGLARMGTPQASRRVYRPQPLASLGKCLLPDLDNIGEVLAIGEGDDYR